MGRSNITPCINKDCSINYPINLKDIYTVKFTPGDFILIREHFDFFGFFISLGQSLRFHGKDAKYKIFTHCGIIINEDGDLLEALAKGVVRTNIARYRGIPHTLVRINASFDDRCEAVKFATSCQGDGYGWMTILSIAVSLLTGLKFSFGFDGQEICSGLVARALERTTAIFPRDGSHITPADLAKYYEVLG